MSKKSKNQNNNKDVTPVVHKSKQEIAILGDGTITERHILEANKTLQEYKASKSSLDNRIIENERWFKLRHWDVMGDKDKANTNKVEPASGWLFNSIINKHADAMDNFPEPSILPRAGDDEEEAEKLTSIIPVILEQNKYEDAYNKKWWYKLKAGTCVTGVFWNQEKNRGLGDIEIKTIDILNLFWQPGIMDVQESRNVFNCKLMDNETLEETYPHLAGRLGSSNETVATYVHDDTVKTDAKSLVVDWYYKRNGKVHLCKYVNNHILYASENTKTYKERGYYDHGRYPFVFDTLFQIEDQICGFGYIDIMKDPQMYIDSMNSILIQNARMAGKKRWFVGSGAGINETEFADWEKDFVHVNGVINENTVKEIQVNQLSNTVMEVLVHKIDELKETSGNRDFSQGGTSSGVTAASAIAALQEAGSKTSRDMIKSSYRAFKEEVSLVIELIRQFYEYDHNFRVTDEEDNTSYIKYNNAHIKGVQQGNSFGVALGVRTPVFDIDVKIHRSNPFSKLAQNELAKEFYSLGFFNPEYAQQSLACIEMMDFEGKAKVIQKINQNNKLTMQMQQMQQTVLQLAQTVDAQNGSNVTQSVLAQFQGAGQQAIPGGTMSSSTISNDPLGKAMQTTRNTTANTAKERATSATMPK